MKWVAAVVLVVASGHARADDADEPDAAKPTAFLIAQLELGATSVRAASTTFTAQGRPLSTGPTSFTATGRELGVTAPAMWMEESEIGIRADHVQATMLFAIGHELGSGSMPTNAMLAPLVDSSSAQLLRVGTELDASWRVRPVVVQAGVAFGWQRLSVDLPGYQLTTCWGKLGSSPCFQTATSAAAFVQPRVRASWGASAFALGAYAGVDAVPELGYAFGLDVTIGLPLSRP